METEDDRARIGTEPMTIRPDLEALVARLRDHIGLESPPVVRTIEAGALRKFAAATGQTDPLYTDEEAARAGPHGAVLAPPTYMSVFTNDTLGHGLMVKDLPFAMFLHTEDQVESFRPIVVGDVITAVARYADVHVREGRNGPMLIQVAEISLTNQRREMVATIRVGSAAFDRLAGE
jgi:acyl dehydratase